MLYKGSVGALPSPDVLKNWLVLKAWAGVPFSCRVSPGHRAQVDPASLSRAVPGGDSALAGAVLGDATFPSQLPCAVLISHFRALEMDVYILESI